MEKKHMLPWLDHIIIYSVSHYNTTGYIDTYNDTEMHSYTSNNTTVLPCLKTNKKKTKNIFVTSSTPPFNRNTGL